MAAVASAIPAMPTVPAVPAAVSASALATAAPLVAQGVVKPMENLHDNNKCASNEEEYGGLCYAKCSDLTGNTHPVRGSAFSCCRKKPCFLNQKVKSILPCHGYDISASGDCPHKTGRCLLNEELLVGVCYEKCSILTKGEYPYRHAPATCCKDSDLMSCLNPMDDKTRMGFDVGGGKGDHDPSTPRGAHLPMDS